MKKSVLIVVLAIAVIFALFVSRQAEASWVLYDDFDGDTINTTKWTVTSNSLNATVGGGSINVSSEESGTFAMQATAPSSTFSGVMMSFNNYSSSTSPTVLGLAFGKSTSDYYSFQRMTYNIGGENKQWLWCGHVVDGLPAGNVGTTIVYPSDAGVMRISYENNKISFGLYKGSGDMDDSTNWNSYGPIASNFDYPNYAFGVIGTGVNGEKSFSIQNVYVDTVPTPIPAAVWLFGSGLLGLFGIRRRFMK